MNTIQFPLAKPQTDRKQIFGFLAVFLVTLGLYIKTLAPTVAFWDAGEFITVSHVLGIPHPPGTPLYVLIGRVFTLLPIAETIAQRVNLLSALFSALAIGFLYLNGVLISKRWLQFGDGITTHLGAASGALVLAASYSFWNSAVEAEVYGLAAFFLTAPIYLALRWAENPAERQNSLYLAILLLSLSVGNHLSSFLAAFGILAMVWLVDTRTGSSLSLSPLTFFPLWAAVSSLGVQNPSMTTLILFAALVIILWAKQPPSWRLVLSAWILFGLAASVHLYLPIRSIFDPAIDEGNPETFTALKALINREQYAPVSILQRKSPLFYQVLMFLGYFRLQMPALAVGMGFLGIVATCLRNRKTLLFLGLMFLASSAGLIVYLNFKLPPNSYLLDQFPPETAVGRAAREVRERDYFFTPSFVFFAHWIGIGAVCFLKVVPRYLREKARLLQGAWGTAFATIIIMAVPIAAIAMNYTKASREDDWLAYDYGFNILNSCDKDAILFTGGDNDTFPLWYLQEVEQQRKDVSVVCLALLNTPWYWKQLRDQSNGLPLPYSDADLEKLGAVPLFQPTYFKAGDLSLKLNATRENPRILRLQDLGVLNIIKHNEWQRPVYFAATVSPEAKLGLDKNLIMEGMVYRLLPQPAPQVSDSPVVIDTERTLCLVDDVYRFRGVFDADVRKTDNTRRLLTNYARIFSLTGREILKQGDVELAHDLFDRAAQIAPKDPASRYYRGVTLHMLGETTEAFKDFLSLADRYPDLILNQARNYAAEGRLDLAEALLTQYVANNQSNSSALSLLDAIRAAKTQAVDPDTAPMPPTDS